MSPKSGTFAVKDGLKGTTQVLATDALDDYHPCPPAMPSSSTDWIGAAVVRARHWFANTSGAKLGAFVGHFEYSLALGIAAVLDVVVVLKRLQEFVVIDGRGEETRVPPCSSESVADILGQES